MACEVVALIDAIELDPVDIVGHDIGGQVAFAFARGWPERCRTVTVIEALLPGVEPFLTATVDVPMWHGEFHMIPDLAERLVVDRQALYFRYFFAIGTRADGAITEEAVERYASSYRTIERLRAAFEMYRATPLNMTWNGERRTPIACPILLIGGEHVFGPTLLEVADTLRSEFGWSSVSTAVLDGGQHYVAEELPGPLLEAHIRR